MSDVLIVVVFFVLLAGGFIALKVSATRSINRFVAEHTKPIDTRAQKRRDRANDKQWWDYQFAALQIAARNKKKETP